MRVIAGEFRGRKLDTFEGMDIRPTTDRVKESLFNIIADKVRGGVFLDLFGGTGGIGIEALSRGAERAVFIDLSPKSIKIIKSNLEKLRITNKAEVYHTDYETAVSKLGRDQRQFDVIFMDPPYKNNFEENALINIDKANILKPNGVIVIEHDSKDAMVEQAGSIGKFREKQYGNTKLSFYTAAKSSNNSRTNETINESTDEEA